MIGKIIGAIIGFAIFRNWLGIVLGMLAGHFLHDARVVRLHPPPTGDFLGPLFAFAGALSKSDGRVSEPEIAAAESLIARLGLDAERRRHAIEEFSAGKQPGYAVDEAIGELRNWCGGRRDRAFVLLDLLLELIHAEGPLAPEKLALLRRLTQALGVTDMELAALAAMRGYGAQARARQRSGPAPGAPALPDPYAVLGVARGASEREIKGAYRRLMSQHHPDKLGNVPEEIKRRAEKRAGEINAAWDRIKAERGF